MASIWFVKEGEPQSGDSIAQKPIDWCVKNLGLKPDNWIAGLEERNLTIGQKTATGAVADYRFVIVKIDDVAGAKGWKPGFYLLDVEPRNARRVIDTVP
jgi:hypothetical protein